MFKLGLIVNPIAGLGGPAGQKGSDHLGGQSSFTRDDNQARSVQRTSRALALLSPLKQQIDILCCPGAMGESEARDAGFSPVVLGGQMNANQSSASDTENAARDLVRAGVDLILFAGGDGTARNIFDAIGLEQVVLGIPAGVKMHSGVYAVSPESASEVVKMLVSGELVNVSEQEVRDIDEEAFRHNQVKARYYGELLVPEAGHFVQHVKNGGREVEALVLDDIAAEVIENMEPEALYIIAPGSTTAAVMEQMGLDNTLLGVDVVKDQTVLASDVSGAELDSLVNAHTGKVVIVLTAIGGQGHIIGRGNQQISPDIIRRAGSDNLLVIATKTKILALEGRPLLVDSNDPELDRELSGYQQVITGYRDTILYPLGRGSAT